MHVVHVSLDSDLPALLTVRHNVHRSRVVNEGQTPFIEDFGDRPKKLHLSLISMLEELLNEKR